MKTWVIRVVSGGAVLISALLIYIGHSNGNTSTVKSNRAQFTVVSIGDKTADIGSVFTRTHFSFTEEDNQQFFGGNGNYTVEAGRGFVFTPHTPNKISQDGGIAFRTLSATSDTHPTLSEVGNYSRQADGSLYSKYDNGIIETLKNIPAGVEQTWELPSAPTGHGDLVVRISAEGDFVSTSSSGRVTIVVYPKSVGVRHS
jgi:hypothetical protein